ncbi:SAPS-domain-containing protein [Exidia glandulosa HHB12029]|uniref:SAPS-domain-containing protein n=1 Tax=Exidia glandulosa HHB12029 TaxID=1314781 RepID=A0A165KCY2_EXIGL|nr:SAPS-domain-containing protein [Exidia glandulosa HHB12029]
MFWRFGFHNVSSIDSLLDREDVSLESILDDDELLSECKNQNTRLIEFFQRVDILQRLLRYVSGEIEGEDRGRFKYPFVATEVLCSEIWSIVETCATRPDELLAPFWDSVLDRSPDDMKTRTVMASHFAKINAMFLTKKPAEMLAFIQSQPRVIERLLNHIETPAFVDLLVRLIQLDDVPSGSGVLEWLSSQHLIPRLVEMLSPTQSSDVHAVVSELLKGIIALGAPSPGSSALSESMQHGTASNLFVRELASTENVTKLVGFLLDDLPPAVEAPSYDRAHHRAEDSTSSVDSVGTPSAPPLPNIMSHTSSLVHSLAILIELIRKNNSDYFEPYLFHTLRNRLIQVQQHWALQSDSARDALEIAMTEMTDRLGVVHLGPLLTIVITRLEEFQQLLAKPRSLTGYIPTTLGMIEPLTLERFRICEFYAELLHCSNMSLLNRPTSSGPVYDSVGRLTGGLSAMEELARVIAINTGDDSQRADDRVDEDEDEELSEAQELPVSTSIASMTDSSSLLSDSEGDLTDDGSDVSLDEFPVSTPRPPSQSPSPSPQDSPYQTSPIIIPSSPLESLRRGALTPSLSASGRNSRRTSRSRSRASSAKRIRESDREVFPIGDVVKQRFIDLNVINTMVELFFKFPWNNFVHNVVYDFIHQILTGRVDKGLNRDLAIALFRDASLVKRIVAGQRQSDIESEKPKGVRLGYMGHLTLIAEDVLNALEHYPFDLLVVIRQFVPQPDWDDYVSTRYRETKRKDTSLLGGGKPVVAPGAARGAQRWKVDEEDEPSSASLANLKNELRKSNTTATAQVPKDSAAAFGIAGPAEDDGIGPAQFASYLAEEMHSSRSTHFDSAGSSDASDDEDDGPWLSRSTVDIGAVPNGAKRTAPPPSSAFDDDFVPAGGASSSSNISFGTSFTGDSDEDGDDFGPFSEAADKASDPFSSPFETKFSDADDAFDFGDFQEAEKDGGDATPTTGSWQWESADTSSSSSATSAGTSTDSLDVPMENGFRHRHKREASGSQHFREP